MAVDYSEGGERVVSERDGGLFYSHLSLYELAAPFMAGRRVLDAGCGTGYGCAHLLERRAASVVGVDWSAKAIKYCRQHFSRPNLEFQIADLNDKLPFADQSFGAIFSSNAMEHIANVNLFLGEARRLLAGDGILFAAVPAITTIGVVENNFRNLFHLTNLTPLSWHRKLSRYFSRVRAFRHWVRDPSGDWSSFRETEWFIEECNVEVVNSTAHIANAVFVATDARPAVEPAGVEEHLLDTLQQSLAERQATVSALRASTSWRITAPLRAARKVAARIGLQ